MIFLQNIILIILLVGMSKIAYDDFKEMNSWTTKWKGICTIPFKKVAFSETPYKRDFKKFAEEVFEAYTNIIEARMNACVNGIQMM